VSDEPATPERPPGLALRPATTADEPFLRELFRLMREPQLAMLPFDEAQRAAFCESQYQARAAHYRDAYPGARHSIVENDGNRVGTLVEARGAAAIHLVDLQLSPAFQARGWGTELMLQLQREASRLGLPVILHVESRGRARRFYERLGFSPGSDDGVYCEMSWVPPGDGVTPR
jgi:GNAT superfamily N-acetyltransferase